MSTLEVQFSVFGEKQDFVKGSKSSNIYGNLVPLIEWKTGIEWFEENFGSREYSEQYFLEMINNNEKYKKYASRLEKDEQGNFYLRKSIFKNIDELFKNKICNPTYGLTEIAEDIINSINPDEKAFEEVMSIFKLYSHPQQFTPDKQGKYSDLTVAIIDDFNSFVSEDLPIPHGKAVQKHYTDILPGVKIVQKDVIIPQDTSSTGDFILAKKSMEHINNYLKELLKEIEDGKKYDAINMSIGTTITELNIEDLKIKSGDNEIKLTNENINQHRDKLKDLYMKQREKFIKELEKEYKTNDDLRSFIKNTLDISDWQSFENFLIERQKLVDEIYDSMKKISDKGVKIFLANNNECGSKLYDLDLADIDPDYENYNNPNIITVSANDSDDRSTPLSDVKAKSKYKFTKVDKGFDITGDGTADIYHKCEDSNSCRICNELDGSEYFGNSFGTPFTGANILKEEHDKTHPEEKIEN